MQRFAILVLINLRSLLCGMIRGKTFCCLLLVLQNMRECLCSIDKDIYLNVCYIEYMANPADL